MPTKRKIKSLIFTSKMKAITIYKASAGTGKTYTLAARYIALLLQDIPASSILAVTFTNKATAEMKQRIIEYLYAIGQSLPEADDVRQTIQQFLPAPSERYPYNDPDFISLQAQKALRDILRDFDHFTVCTIDSFLQTLLAGLARDLGYTAHFKVELSDTEVIEKAVDDLMRHLSDSPRLQHQVEEFIKQRMDDEKGWDVRKQLKSLAKELTRETYLRHGQELNEALSGEDKLKDYRTSLHKDSTFTEEGDIRKKLKSRLQKFQENFDKSRLKYAQDAISWTTNIQNSLDEAHSLKESDYFRQPSNRLAEFINNPETWAKKSENSGYAAEKANLLKNIQTLAASCARFHNSRKLTLKHLNELSLLDDIHHKVEQIEQENDRFLLAQTPIKLYEVIRQEPTDATFILERAGIRYHHIMIDEFQDTSSLQWENFMPLTEEIIASGGTALFVGDVKQSIYRWRGGDWDILGSIDEANKPRRLGRHFREETAEIIPLDKNFRSQETIVQFNLQFFHQASSLLDKWGNEQLSESASDPQAVKKGLAQLGFKENTIHQLYLTKGYDPEQPDLPKFCAHPNGKGYVRVALYPTNRNQQQTANEQILLDMFHTLFQLHDQGMPYDQMAILVRTHSLTATIVSYLDAHWKEFQENGQAERPAIVSAEAFLLRASTSVQMIISALRYLHDKSDLISLCYLARHYQEDTLSHAVTDWTAITSRLGQGPEVLKELLPAAFVEQREALAHYPLYELIEQLISLLLFAPGSSRRSLTDDAYLFAFLDETVAYLSDQSSSLDDFLDYWDNTLSQKSIPASDQSRGIQVVSIHKSKGLQYKTVFLPNCDWDLEKDRTDDLLWCEPAEEPYNDIPYIPITPTGIASNSIYNVDYQSEHLKRRIDNLNLLYVAFTRAENNLYVWSKVERPSNSKQPEVPHNTVGQLISYTLGKNAEVLQQPADDPAPIVCTYGEPYIPSSASSDEPKTENRFKLPQQNLFASFAPHSDRLVFRQSNQSAEFLQALEGDMDNRKQYIRQGNLLHKIYSEINAADDAPQVLQAFQEQGLIEDETQLQSIRAIIARGWQNELVNSWFDGSWTLYRECSILSRQPGSGQVVIRRPDRVMTKDGQTVVVDFKFGKPRPDYALQVQTYMQLLRRMGHDHVSGYLWYVYDNRIESVSAPQE